MFNIEKSHCYSMEQMLLYNIHEYLRQLNDQKKETVSNDTCNLCGGVHINAGERLACAKKHKRKGE